MKGFTNPLSCLRLFDNSCNIIFFSLPCLARAEEHIWLICSNFFVFKQLSRQDPVHTVCLKSYVVSQLNACQQTHGQSSFDMLMGQVAPEVVRQLEPFCK